MNEAASSAAAFINESQLRATAVAFRHLLVKLRNAMFS